MNSNELNRETNVIVTRQTAPYHHQLPPYGKLGDPYVITKHTLLYPESKYRIRWGLLQKRRLTEQLFKCFPFVYVLTHAACLLLNSVVQIALQIALMSTNGALWFVAAGIWGGVYFLITAGFTLLLVFKRSYWLFIVSYFMHLFGVLVCIGAYLVVNILAIAEYTDKCSYYPNCFNESVKPLNYIMFFLGVICLIMLLVYLVLLPCYIMDYIHLRKKYRQEKQQDIEHKNDELKHSSLYIQNDLDENGNFKNENKIAAVRNIMYEYPVDRY